MTLGSLPRSRPYWLLIVAGLVLTPSSVYGQTTLSEGELTSAVGTMTQILRDYYLFEEMGERMAHHVQSQFDAGAYSGLSAEALTQQLTTELREVSNDKHMYVLWDPELVAAARSGTNQRSAQQGRSSAEVRELRWQRAIDSNFGLDDFRWLPERVGYVHITGFTELRYAEQAYEALLKYFGHAEAMIFDLRGNGGGHPNVIRLLQSQFFEESQLLLTFTNRAEGREFEERVWADPDGIWQGIPIYILIDQNAGSAGEDFPYTTKHAGEGVLVGERTAGAGHMNRVYPIEPGFEFSISIAGPVGAVTGGNWEGTGVEPDIAVLPPEALLVAYGEILRGMLADADDDVSTRIRVLLQETETELAAMRTHDSSLDMYAGIYGDRVVEVVGSSLRLTGGGRIKFFRRIGDDLFERVGARARRLRFDVDEGRATSLVVARRGVDGERYDRTGG